MQLNLLARGSGFLVRMQLGSGAPYKCEQRTEGSRGMQGSVLTSGALTASRSGDWLPLGQMAAAGPVGRCVCRRVSGFSDPPVWHGAPVAW